MELGNSFTVCLFGPIPPLLNLAKQFDDETNRPYAENIGKKLEPCENSSII